jgi:hypothetical protein
MNQQSDKSIRHGERNKPFFHGHTGLDTTSIHDLLKFSNTPPSKETKEGTKIPYMK